MAPAGKREEKKGSCCARNPEEKAKEFRRVEDQAPEKEVCAKDASKGKKEAYL